MTSSEDTCTPATPVMADTYWMRQSTAPSKSSDRSLPSPSRVRSPSVSAPSILNRKREPKIKNCDLNSDPLEPMMEKEKKEKVNKKVDILKINHVQSDTKTDPNTTLPGSVVTNSTVTKNMTNSVKTVINANSINSNSISKNHVPPNSKSDGDLLKVSKVQNNHVPNSHSENFLKNQDQCCTGFATANGKPSFNANNCVLI